MTWRSAKKPFHRRAHDLTTMPTRTKIVATLGPSSSSSEQIRALIGAGVDVFRINFSHGDHDYHHQLIENIRSASNEARNPVAILADLQGPKIRIGKIDRDKPMLLALGDELTIVGDPKLEASPGRVGCTYPDLAKEVRKGEPILLDDGSIELEVLEATETEVRTRVVFGGVLRSHKGINLPGTQVQAPSLGKKDRADLDFALDQDVDFLALSFVRSADDVKTLRYLASFSDAEAEIIAKIERPEAVRNIREIIEASDGIMVARGDMGVELGPEEVPAIQKRIIKLCIDAGKSVITATQMLESMTSNSRPTRAEASDVANAIYDGTSAIMLSGETAAGKHPELVVRTMDRIARRTEVAIFDDEDHDHLNIPTYTSVGPVPIDEATVAAAAHGASLAGVSVIVIFTESGHTAKLLARERLPLRLIAMTPEPRTHRRLKIQWGIIPVLTERFADVETMHREAERLLLELRHIRPGELVVFAAGQLQMSGGTNTVSIRQIPD